MAYTHVATDFRRLPRALRRMLAEYGDDVREAANQALDVAHAEAINLTHAGEHVVKGDYLAGFHVKYDRSRTTGGGTLANSSNHAEVMEFGAQPHLPPYHRIREWVEAKFGISGNHAHFVTKKIRDNIMNEGLPTSGSPHAEDGGPFRIMGRAAEAAEDYLEEEFRELGSAAVALRRLIRHSLR